MSRCLLRQVRCLQRAVVPSLLRRYAARPQQRRTAKVEHGGDLQLSKDPGTVVRQAHRREISAFRRSLDDGDFAKAYQIYIEQRGLPFLGPQDITSMVQLISADAYRRTIDGQDQPGIMKTVLETIIEDVKSGKTKAFAMIWVHVLEAQSCWSQFDEAEELWTWLKTLPNRTSADRSALCIDSRIYGQMLRTRFLKGMPIDDLRALYVEALDDRKLHPSIILSQAIIEALIEAGQKEEALKHLDHTIETQRNVLRSGFFDATMTMSLDSGDLKMALHLLKESFKIRCPPQSQQVTRLITEMSRSDEYGLDEIMALYKDYRLTFPQFVPIYTVNAVIGAIFASARRGISKEDVLERVHAFIKQATEDGSQPSTATINILLAGYLELGQSEMAKDLMSRVDLNEYSFRTLLKSLISRQAEGEAGLVELKEIWTQFVTYRQQKSNDFVLRDLQMVLRAAHSLNHPAALTWLKEAIEPYQYSLDEDSSIKFDRELHERDRMAEARERNKKEGEVESA